MNKKAYISPATLVVTVKLSMMISVSTNVDGLGFSSQSTDEAEITTAGVKNSGYNVWDDDWSEIRR